MLKKVSPEQAGIESKYVLDFLSKLEKPPFCMHQILIAKDDKVFLKANYKPYGDGCMHRCYSMSKSFVGIAIMLLVEQHKIKLKDKLISYFKEYDDETTNKLVKNQSIKDTLQMSSLVISDNWFESESNDRAYLYFHSKINKDKSFKYDSAGSYVLCELVERLTGKTLIEYLKERLFDKMGIFNEYKMLKVPTNYSWGDSGLICKIEDIVEVGRLLLNKGRFQGKQLIKKKTVKMLTSYHVSTKNENIVDCKKQGYAYQIWKVKYDGFAFFGMGDQMLVCYPKTKLILASFGDNQGMIENRQAIFDNFESSILNNIKDSPIDENKIDEDKLNDYLNTLKLVYLESEDTSETYKRVFLIDKNDFNINKIVLDVNKDEGSFTCFTDNKTYTILFGINKNVFSKFPLGNASNEIGKIKEIDHHYNMACSLKIENLKHLELFIQIIDEYLGHIHVYFDINSTLTITFKKVFEDYLNEFDNLVLSGKETYA